MKISGYKCFWIGLLAVLVMASAGCAPIDSGLQRNQIQEMAGDQNIPASARDVYEAGVALMFNFDETISGNLPPESMHVQNTTPAPEPTIASTATPVVTPSASWQPDIASPTAASASIPAVPEKRILVNLSEQRVYAYEHGALVYQFPVSTGRNNNTAVGGFKILDKKPYPYSEPWGFWMPHWMGIYWVAGMENGFHALPVLENGKELWGDQIGSPASNGCVVLLPEDMALLFEWSEVGMPVEIVE